MNQCIIDILNDRTKLNKFVKLSLSIINHYILFFLTFLENNPIKFLL